MSGYIKVLFGELGVYSHVFLEMGLLGFLSDHIVTHYFLQFHFADVMGRKKRIRLSSLPSLNSYDRQPSKQVGSTVLKGHILAVTLVVELVSRACQRSVVSLVLVHSGVFSAGNHLDYNQEMYVYLDTRIRDCWKTIYILLFSGF